MNEIQCRMYRPDGTRCTLAPGHTEEEGVAEERKRATGFALDEPPDPSGFDKAVVRVRWPGAWAQLVDEGGYDYPRWGILGTRLDVCPTGDTEAEAWAEAARRAGEASR
jgi:hypothetical protein